MKIAVISPYPPSKGTLNEYAFHFVQNLKFKSEVTEIVILTDQIVESYPEDDNTGCKITIDPCWKFNSLNTPIKIVKALKKHKADLAMFNIQFLSFGDKKVAGALGLMTPVLSRMFGIPSLTLLHNITETVDYESAGITNSKMMMFLYNFIGTILTQILLLSNVLAVTMPKYVNILKKKYKSRNIALIPHGTFEIPEYVETQVSGKKKVMTFGKFGTYKKVEEMIEAVEIVRDRNDMDIEIVIAGTDNPNVKGYLENVRNTYSHVNDITFTGYVEEEDVPTIFRESTVVVFPYTSTTGSSGVLHQAGSYGKSVVLPQIGDLKELIEEEGYRGEYFKPSDVMGMADAIEKLLTQEDYRKELEETNYAAACSLPMSDIADWYLLHFEHLVNNNKEIKEMTKEVESPKNYKSLVGV